ncbi:MAG: glycogen/starch synthase [archaeon]
MEGEHLASWAFEASWEVCNKVGGIYTVVTSKANQMMHYYGSQYVTVGPYIIDRIAGEFVEELSPPAFKDAFSVLKAQGIHCHWGKWLVKGQPNTILIDFQEFTTQLNAYKGLMWEKYGIDTLGTQYFDYDQPFIWSIAVGKLIEALADKLPPKIVLHCHEWLAGAAILYIKQARPDIATVFTTHATILGRTLASAQKDLYDLLDKIDPVKEAYSLGIQAKHLTEMKSAQLADVFTTVSEITGMEAEKFLLRKPDVLLLNGLDFSKFPTFEEITIKHSLYKQKMKEFLVSYFFPYYSFDLTNTLFFFIAGRYEFRDKGIDIFINALGKLNEQLKEECSAKTIVAFIWVPAAIRAIRHELLESRTFYTDVIESVDENFDDIRLQILHSLVVGTDLRESDMFDEQTRDDIRKKVLKFKKKGLPSLSTHELSNEYGDDILRTCAALGLHNRNEDRVKIIFYPIYLTGADGLLDLNYYESMMASHLGIFPSYYEPWGYTPLEGAALGVSSITTDLAGFGKYVQTLGKDTKGVFVLNRLHVNEKEVTAQLSSFMFNYCHLTKEERINYKLEARKIAAQCDWKRFVLSYIRAHDLAVEKVR